MICVSLVSYDWSIWWHIRLFSLLDHPLICQSKAILKKKIRLAFSGTSIFNPICLLHEKSFIVGGLSFQISERGSSTLGSELGSLGELISSSDIVEASGLFGDRLYETPRVGVPLPLLLLPLVLTLELNPSLFWGLPQAGEGVGVSTAMVWPQ